MKNNCKILLKNSNIEAIQYSPQKRTLCINGRYYFLQLPYLIFVKKYSSFFVFCSKEEANKNMVLYRLLLPNVNWDHSICLNMESHFNASGKTLETCIDEFWANEFILGRFWPCENVSFREWEKLSCYKEIIDKFKVSAWSSVCYDDVLKKIQEEIKDAL